MFGSPGVLMWEVFTEGRMPFEQSHNHEVVTLVTQGHRLYRPKMAKPAIYDTMQMCWYEVSKKWEVNFSYEAFFYLFFLVNILGFSLLSFIFL